MANNSPLVSIIIPAYNTAPYIHRAIGSSLRQTHKNIEIVIIDDGSTDDTLRVVQSFAETDSRIRVLSQKNAGVSAARNHGISEAKGEYLYFLDSDDWLEDDAIEFMLKAQSEHPDSIICANYNWNVMIEGSDLLLRDNPSERIPSRYMSLKDMAKTYSFMRFSGHIFNLALFHSAHSKLFRTPFSVRFPEDIKYSEDLVFFIKYIAEAGVKVYYVNKPVVNVLQRAGSARQTKYKPQLLDAQVTAYKTILEFADDEECRQFMLMGRNNFVERCLMIAVQGGTDREEIKRIKSVLKDSVWLTIKSREYPLGTRLRYLLAAFAPVTVYRAFLFAENLLRRISGKMPPEETAVVETIHDWQDFPKAT